MLCLLLLLHCVACCTAWPAALRGLCSKAEKKKTLAQWETLVKMADVTAYEQGSSQIMQQS